MSEKTWIPVLIQNRVYAVDPRSGTRREMTHRDGWTVAGVSGLNEEIAVAYSNGRVRIWNPTTDSARLIN